MTRYVNFSIIVTVQAKRISRSLSDILQESEDEEENQCEDSDVDMGSENGDVPMPDAMTRYVELRKRRRYEELRKRH